MARKGASEAPFYLLKSIVVVILQSLCEAFASILSKDEKGRTKQSNNIKVASKILNENSNSIERLFSGLPFATIIQPLMPNARFAVPARI
jgi:hypothetical protein